MAPTSVRGLTNFPPRKSAMNPSRHVPFVRHVSSSPGEFHPQALTEPDGSLSTHPALITRPRAASPRQVLPITGLTRRRSSGHGLHFPAEFLPIAGLTRRRNRMIGPLRSRPITGPSTLLRAHPPLCPASVLWPSWGFHLGFSLGIEATGSQVPRSSQDRTRATFMPDATRAVSGSPPR